jgi:hypothetical protein
MDMKAALKDNEQRLEKLKKLTFIQETPDTELDRLANENFTAISQPIEDLEATILN